MDKRQALWALHEMRGIGWSTIDCLVRSMSDLAELDLMEAGDLAALGLQNQKADVIASHLMNKDWLRRKEQKLEKLGIRWMTVWDGDYPELLRQIKQYPWVLYYLGNAANLKKPCFSVVGTRNPTAYGRRAAERICGELSSAGICVVSGLARGIDTSAHVGALQGHGSTIAVLGGPLDCVYPPENRALYRQIADCGLLVSEYPLETPVHPGMFPVRNRIIAGLSLGTMVVEAADRSGSLITASQALDESRDVFAVPGPITSPKSEGTLALIKQGAKLVTSAKDILEEYVHLYPELADGDSGIKRIGAGVFGENLTEEETQILQCMSSEPVSIDELLERSQINFGLLHSVLLSLTMKKRIEQLPGSTYVLS
ncbi:MAG: protecting protein DprA [Paenibacillaceae bacterium]|jgi:DNA processing protein|nr:protecting protein DprA [Paenibacillaceae bacterium]